MIQLLIWEESVHFLMAFELEIKSICVITRYLENSFQSQGNTIVLMSVVLNALDASQGLAGSAGRVERSQLSPLDFDLYRLKKGLGEQLRLKIEDSAFQKVQSEIFYHCICVTKVARNYSYM